MDDLITTCKNTEIAELIINWLLSQFDELKITFGEIRKFTGMVFDFISPRKLKITMKKKALLEDILKQNTITGKDDATPSTPELFHIDAR